MLGVRGDEEEQVPNRRDMAWVRTHGSRHKVPEHRPVGSPIGEPKLSPVLAIARSECESFSHGGCLLGSGALRARENVLEDHGARCRPVGDPRLVPVRSVARHEVQPIPEPRQTTQTASSLGVSDESPQGLCPFWSAIGDPEFAEKVRKIQHEKHSLSSRSEGAHEPVRAGIESDEETSAIRSAVGDPEKASERGSAKKKDFATRGGDFPGKSPGSPRRQVPHHGPRFRSVGDPKLLAVGRVGAAEEEPVSKDRHSVRPKIAT